MKTGIFSLMALLTLSACATGISTQKYNDLPASKDAFSICHGYSCSCKSEAGFDKDEWNKIARTFSKKPAATPEAERVKIGNAIAMMEKISGHKTGTDQDDGQAISLKKNDLQLDCIDETVNTTMYLKLLEQDGLLKFYKTAEPTHRGYFIDGSWPHNTAVIEEIKTGDLYVVDSFYRANGEEPYVMPRQKWLDGWKPPGSRQ